MADAQARTMILVIFGHSLRSPGKRSKSSLKSTSKNWKAHLASTPHERRQNWSCPKSLKAHLASTPHERAWNSARDSTPDRSKPTRPAGTADSAFKCNPKRPVSSPRISSIRMRTRASCCRRMVAAATPAPAAQTAGSTLASCAPMERATRAGRGSRAPMKGTARADALWQSSSHAASTISLRAAMGGVRLRAAPARRWRFR